MFFLMQDQTAYINEEETGCDPPRGNNALSNVKQCRNGEGAVVYSFYDDSNPLLMNGCQYTYIRYAPCLPDEAVTNAVVSLNTTIECDGVLDMASGQFKDFLGDFIQHVKNTQKANGIPNPIETVISICVRTVVSAGRMLAAETAYKRMETVSGSAIYNVTAEITTECDLSCVGVDFVAVETALVKSISSATENIATTNAVVNTEFASTG